MVTDNTHIMPFRITVASGSSFDLGHPTAFNYNGIPICSLVKKYDSKRFVNFTENLYMELLSIQDVQSAIEFIKANNPNLQFIYYQSTNPRGSIIEESESLDCLGEIVVASIQNFLLISTFVSKQQEYQQLLKEKDPDTTKKKEALARKKEICRAEMVAIYTKLFRLLGKKTRSYTSYEQMYSFYFDIHDKVEEVVEQVYEKRESWETFEECYNYLVEQYFKENEALREEHYEQVTRTVNSIVDDIMFTDISGYINGILEPVEVVFDATEMSFTCNCPDLISAMYMWMYVALNSGKEYKICAHKNCQQYFLVNKSHPQTRCPLHMQARQRKRENNRIYPDDYYTHHVH